MTEKKPLRKRIFNIIFELIVLLAAIFMNLIEFMFLDMFWHIG